ncbi:MAG: hypothetical protein AAF789_12190 [Bacteroidota bacterium]
MEDKLESFVIKNRSSFEEDADLQPTWNKIEQRLNKRQRPSLLFWKIAAITCLISTFTLLLERKSQTEKSPFMSQDLEAAEQYYAQLIHQRKEEINVFPIDASTEDLMLELEKLDVHYTELKEVLKVNNTNERLLNALINNLQLRLKILDGQLQLLKKFNNQEHETSQNT